MKEDNIVKNKSFTFAINIVHLVQQLEQNRNYVISRQILKSGTSIAANIEESIGAESPLDFIHKLSIAYKEARETLFWLKLLKETKIIDVQKLNELISDNEEIIRLLVSSIKTNKDKGKLKRL